MTPKRFAAALILASSTMFLAPAQGQYGPPPPPPGAYQQGGWDTPPGAYSQYAQQGFRDGIEGARKDVENHRQPNVNNRDEYRHPSVPGQFRRDYRKGFRQGYNTAMRHMMDGRR